ncbi:hypothetical protein COU62_03325 [Candidatus Pacearchaeota archaeon CG10_big_fil_rev_8_21_14_0_10_35_219]|nr:hypothetical protein [Candidatus Pacearchaeota archaeon]OIO42378.1 MAG: hypothetical protein AUJ63_03835 [Candidatus Pacearchaeota archaeon CG1_02_35_32]PIO07385.1 MAG: hypothetical protein COU62_03325 [Candidatus Pacearchaeota archaeon CG10_big_fil_rev_8_21_14_0_10_35_219]PIY81686.1 MAG: hypothetical protein COY79_01265 [Candidatus Pacearchaeota archaeon CG_4_10_14_0_8_um_filter_35_169]PIZ79503.1 MAG: hypothetical protein COY00_03730 [Candidatus Pacearchaeota archaeon CG_4_10_14_0_2_um_filt
MNEEDSIPHISLCMGCAKKEDVEEIEKIVSEIARDFMLVEIEISKLSRVESGSDIIYFFEVEKIINCGNCIKRLWIKLNHF